MYSVSIWLLPYTVFQLKNDPTLVFRVAGSHFVASADSSDVVITRHLFFGPFQHNKVLRTAFSLNIPKFPIYWSML